MRRAERTIPLEVLWAVLVLASMEVSRAQDAVPIWIDYNEYSYINGWAIETYPNFPLAWWNSPPACPSAVFTGVSPGVVCQVDPVFGMNQAVEIDLSPGSLPPGSVNLTGGLKTPPFLVGLRFLVSLNLERTGLAGSLPGSLNLASSLTRLVLANNNISGPIPPELCTLNLTCLNLANNSFSGTIPPCWRNKPCVDFQGNKLTRVKDDCNSSLTVSSCSPTLTIIPPTPPPPGQSAVLSTGAIIGIVLGFLVLVGLCVGGIVFWKKHSEKVKVQQAKQMLTERVEAELLTAHTGVLKRFLLEDLVDACDNFNIDNCIGEGGYSLVYKGILPDKNTVAVKKMKMKDSKENAELDFIAEVELISRASHRHLAQCVGYCLVPGDCMCLVLQYYANGSVASRTQGKQGVPLNWPTRVKIAKGAAQGLAYLHNDCQPPIIHRDIKPENILLDWDDEPAVADFGLAKGMEDSEGLNGGDNRTGIKGTLGHIAPEYFLHGQCSLKTDVYAFGIFLLELVSGASIFDLTASSEESGQTLQCWLEGLLESDKVKEVIDPELLRLLDVQFQLELSDEVAEVCRIALACIQNEADDRPSMDIVCSSLSQGSAQVAALWANKLPEDLSEAGTRKTIMDLTNPEAWDNLSTGVFLPPVDRSRYGVIENIGSKFSMSSLGSNQF